jgi:hypothetical protein
MVCEDAKKEFGDRLTVVFGFDGAPEDRQTDIDTVRGRYEDHALVKELRQKIEQYAHIYEEIIRML